MSGVLHKGDTGPEYGEGSGPAELDSSPHAWGGAGSLQLLADPSVPDGNFCHNKSQRWVLGIF